MEPSCLGVGTCRAGPKFGGTGSDLFKNLTGREGVRIGILSFGTEPNPARHVQLLFFSLNFLLLNFPLKCSKENLNEKQI